MKKQTNENEGQECPSERARAQLHRALRLLSGKWKGEILWQLVDGKQRFGQLRRAIPDVTQHMLTTQLRDLESEGLVKRTVFPEVPPRVEYEMTPAAGRCGQYSTNCSAGPMHTPGRSPVRRLPARRTTSCREGAPLSGLS
ncbi:DNA-binding HxlR family transcriptional regulator [Bradyrhizobium algeriense]|uniref:DNA-binding HxlR family transcriptional regulator n=1 Tax=Bradyrhizobium algeriense TaxID=634784 RepID=A0ABU8BP03_9BRAD